MRMVAEARLKRAIAEAGVKAIGVGIKGAVG
jgi:hypothetical protein